MSSKESEEQETSKADKASDSTSDFDERLLIHWKGEKVQGYSMQFRHVELEGALTSVLDPHMEKPKLVYENALDYTGDQKMSEVKLVRFNHAMQYVSFKDKALKGSLIKAVQRCSLVHALYQICAETKDYDQMLKQSMENGSFDDMMAGGENEKASWCVRVRQFGEHSEEKKQRRHGDRARSFSEEQGAIEALAPLLRKILGDVNLSNPDFKIFVFTGLTRAKQTLTRRIATCPKTSIIAPVTRVCITTTPLMPIPAFSLCNVAGLRPGCRVLDPYGGSGAVLLAVAMIEPTCQTVSIEIAHSGLVNRDHIRQDFEKRNFTMPKALIKGDSNDVDIRKQAREAVGDVPFDLIITDPPYGIRESKFAVVTPITELLKNIAHDREAGRPLLVDGGKLVCFLPCKDTENFKTDILPSDELLREACLEVELYVEQPLNSKLSRWLVSFRSKSPFKKQRTS